MTRVCPHIPDCLAETFSPGSLPKQTRLARGWKHVWPSYLSLGLGRALHVGRGLSSKGLLGIVVLRAGSRGGKGRTTAEAANRPWRCRCQGVEHGSESISCGASPVLRVLRVPWLPKRPGASLLPGDGLTSPGCVQRAREWILAAAVGSACRRRAGGLGAAGSRGGWVCASTRRFDRAGMTRSAGRGRPESDCCQ